MRDSGEVTLKDVIDFNLCQLNSKKTVGEIVVSLYLNDLINLNQLKKAKLPLNYWRDICDKSKNEIAVIFDVAKEELKLSSIVIKQYAEKNEISLIEAAVALKAKRVLCKDDIEYFYAVGDENIKIREKILQIFSLLDELKKIEN